MKPVARCFSWMLRLVVVLGIGCLLFVSWGLWFEKPWLRYQNLPFPPAAEKVKAGEAVVLSVERCSDAPVTETYRTTHGIQSAKDQKAILLPDVVVSVDPGCHRDASKINVVPKGTAPGRYVAFGVALVPGLIRTFAVPWYSEEFEVVP